MKKAFTMLELVIVIVVVGIISAVLIPRDGSNRLAEAAAQLVGHIRYTQHLAMVDDRYDANNLDSVNNIKWYKERWQLIFTNGVETNNQDAYTIFSDTAGDSTGNVDISEVAVSPENPNQLMSGGFAGGVNALDITHDSFIGINKLNLGRSYGVSNVTFSNSCKIGISKRIAFDHLGRPIKGSLSSTTLSYHTTQRLITDKCNIELSDGTNNITIVIEPETGYTYID